MRCVEEYRNIYEKEPMDVSFCPYRICPIGAHSDHNLGKITGFAINKGINIAYGISEAEEISATSIDFDSSNFWHINDIKKSNDWADYLRGATYCLNKKYPLSYGVNCVIEGSLPIGGLSSSAAVIIAFINCLLKANNISISKQELIDIAYVAENEFVGVKVGKLDQSCIVLSKKDHLLYLDTKDNSYQLIKKPLNMKAFDIVVFYSGLEHSLVTSGFNDRVKELKSAAKSLAKLGGIDIDDPLCRDIPMKVYEKYKDSLNEIERLRADHWFSEFKRVELGAKAFETGDIEEYGRLIFESGESSIVNWQTGAKEQIRLYEIMKETKGIYGGRFSGAGFKGSCIGLVNKEYTNSVIEEVSKKYIESFPQLKDKYKAYICETCDGVML